MFPPWPHATNAAYTAYFKCFWGPTETYSKYHTVAEPICDLIASEKSIYDHGGLIVYAPFPRAFGTVCYEGFGISAMHLAAPRSAGMNKFAVVGGPGNYTIYFSIVWTGPSEGGLSGCFSACPLAWVGGPAVLQPKLCHDGAGAPRQGLQVVSGNLDTDTLNYAKQVVPGSSSGPLPFNHGTRVSAYVKICADPITGLDLTPGTGTVPIGVSPWIVDFPHVQMKFWRLIHDSIILSTVMPPHLTLLADGGSVLIEATPDTDCTLTTFLVDGLDCLTKNPFLKEDIHADVHVTAISEKGVITIKAGTPTSQVLSLAVCADCGPVTWTADFGTLSGLTIDSVTGLISGTIDYTTVAGIYPVAVTADNGGRSTTRTFLINVTAADIFGHIWTGVTKLQTAITAICQTTTGRILLGTSNLVSIYKTDLTFASFTDVDPTATTIEKTATTVHCIRQLASGRLIAIIGNSTAGQCNVITSDNDGDTWTRRVNAGGTVWFSRDAAELTGVPQVIFTFESSGGSIKVWKSADDAATFSAGYTYSEGLNHYGKRLMAISTTQALMTGTSTGNGSEIFLLTGSVGALAGSVITSIAVNSATLGQMAIDGTGAFLVPVNTILYAGDTTAFAARYTAVGVIGAVEYLTQNTVVIGVNGNPMTIFRSTDNGVTFTPATATPGDGAVNVCKKLSDSSILMGTSGGVSNLLRSTA